MSRENDVLKKEKQDKTKKHVVIVLLCSGEYKIRIIKELYWPGLLEFHNLVEAMVYMYRYM